MEKIKRQKEQIKHSLGARVVLVCAVFLIIPLLFHTIYLFVYDYRVKKQELLIGLDRAIKGQIRYAEELSQDQLELLTLLSRVPGVINAPFDAELIDNLTKKINFSSLIYAEKKENGTLFCLFSNKKELVGKELPFSLEKSSFLQPDLITEEPLIHRIYATSRGFLIGGSPAMELISRKEVMAHKEASFAVALADESGKFFVTEGGDFKDEMFADYPTVDLETFHLNTLPRSKDGKQRYQLKTKIDQTDLYLLFKVNSFALEQISKTEATVKLFSQLLFVIILGSIGSLLLIRRLSRPLFELIEVMDAIELGDQNQRYKKDKMGFEINVLGVQFNKTIDALFLQQQATEKERIAKELFAKDLAIGAAMQREMIPEEPPVCRGVEIATAFLPAKELGGDFYDFYFDKAEKNLYISIADAAEKGIHACLFSLSARSMIRSFATSINSPSICLEKANDLCCLDAKMGGMFVTALLSVIELDSGKLSFANAGHPFGIIVKNEDLCEELAKPGLPLGIDTGIVYQEGHTRLNKGDLLFLYTDGVSEAMSPEKELYGTVRLQNFLKSHFNKPIEQIKQLLFSEMKTFTEGGAQSDDITFVLVRKT